MSNYGKGRAFEYTVRDLFRENGFVVIRSAQSKPLDLVCMKKGSIYFVECKVGSGRINSDGKAKLLELGRVAGAKVIYAKKEPGNNEIKLTNLKSMKSFKLASLQRIPVKGRRQA